MDPSPPLRTLGAILAGGASRRFGANKALAPLGGVPLIEHARRSLGRAVAELVVVTSDPEVARAARADPRPDRIAGGGALAGLHAALHRADELGRPGVLAVACDMPFLSPALLARLAAQAEAEAPPALAPLGATGPEPLCAWYSVALLPRVEERLRRGERGLRHLLADVGAHLLPAVEVRRYGPAEIQFLNVNTPAEFAAAETLLHDGPVRDALL